MSIRSFIAKIAATVLLLGTLPAQAEPYLAYQEKWKCSVCHVNPDGGGMRNAFGSVYGQQQMPMQVANYDATSLSTLNDFIRIGADWRYDWQYTEQDGADNSSGFEVDSAQIYLSAQIPDTGLTLYFDQKVAPGSVSNREALLLYQLSPNSLVKVGRMYVPVGIRLQDDTAFIKQATGFNFDNSDNGIQFSMESQQAILNIFVTNGTSAVSNDDNKFQVGTRGEYLFSHWRLGATALFNDTDEGDTTLLNLYTGLNWGDWTFLAEADYQNQDSNEDESTQLIGLAEVNYRWMKGLNLKLTGEYLDPDDTVDEDHKVRYSLVTELTPISNFQIRGGYRYTDGIPQRPQDNTNQAFIQGHFYF